jgi:hypothetical protein
MNTVAEELTHPLFTVDGPGLLENAAVFGDPYVYQMEARRILASMALPLRPIAQVPRDMGLLHLEASGMPKVVIPEETTPALIGLAQAGTIVGSIGHNVLRHAYLSPSQILDFADEQYEDGPAIYADWAMRVGEATPEFTDLLAAPAGEGQVLVREARIPLKNKEAIEAAQQLNEALREEQLNGNGFPGPIELALRSSPALTHRGKANGYYSTALANIPPESPLQASDLRHLVQLARTHHLTKRGNMLVCPTSQPDVLDFRFDKKDLEASNASRALKRVLDAHIGFDAEELYKLPITFINRNSRTGEEEEIEMNGLEVVNWAAGLMCQGRINCHVVDIKFQTHTGKKWEHGLQYLWDDEEYDGDIKKIVTNKHLKSEDPKFFDLQRHWREPERDLARTAYSVMSFMKYSVREFRARNKGEIGYPVSWTKLRDSFTAYVAGIDFDVRNLGDPNKPDEPPKPNREYAKAQLNYVVTPQLSSLAVPHQVGMVLRQVSRTRFNRDIERRGSEMRDQLRAAGRVLLQAYAG